MCNRVPLWLCRLFDAGEAKTAFGRALLAGALRALQRQSPLLYAIALVDFLGLDFASGGEPSSRVQPGPCWSLVVVRLVHWVRPRGRALPPERISWWSSGGRCSSPGCSASASPMRR